MKCRFQVPILEIDIETLDYHYELKRVLILLSTLWGKEVYIVSHDDETIFLTMLNKEGRIMLKTQLDNIILIDRIDEKYIQRRTEVFLKIFSDIMNGGKIR